MATAAWNLPTWGPLDSIPSLAALLNAQSTALDTALTSAINSNGWRRYTTYSSMTAVVNAAVGAHATVYADSNANLNGDYRWTGSAWVRDWALAGTLTPVSFYTAQVDIIRQGGRIYLEGVIGSSAVSFVAGTTYTVGNIPSALAPARAQVFACVANSTALAGLGIGTDGTVTMVLNSSFSGALVLQTGSTSWRQK